MASSENEPSSHSSPPPPPANICLQKFRLYETLSNFYMIGRDNSRTYWKVLKIDRLDPSELTVLEDSTTYTERECSDLLRRIHEGNRSTGGLKFVTTCYGIVGFIKFLGPYYMVVITKRRKIGAICGHTVYAVSKSETIPLQNPSVQSNIDENRYRKLLLTVDLTKDFYFSYSYYIMRSLQRNLCDSETGHVLYENMFVWNEFLTRGIRNHLQNTIWTVALVYGFFKQETLAISGREFILTLIARRSRHYAGTRYLRRGLNDKGRVANDVETEQIVFEDVPEGLPVQICSVVQNRGSIPLFWSQETSRLNLKPDIILSKKDQNYQATKLHFENLVKRYGNPIIILNLIKSHERKPRESILRSEFGNAINFINKDLSEENRLRFLHWDLKHFQSKATNVLLLLGKVATYALTLTGFLYCQVSPTPRLEECIERPPINFVYDNIDKGSFQPTRHVDVDNEDGNNLERKPSGEDNHANGNHFVKPPMFQRGVLRTNCIDCLDRTNVAQYAYGLAALGHQLHALGIIDHLKIDLEDPVSDDLMGFYERMGDTLAHQYGGSAAHNKIFSERRGQWKAATQSQEFFRTLQRYYSNAYMDAEKQNAINIFLGHFQPQVGKPALWDLGSDQHYDIGRHGDDDARAFVKRCFSDGSIIHGRSSPTSASNSNIEKFSKLGLQNRSEEGNNDFCDSLPEISTFESDMAFSRYTPSLPRRQLFVDAPRERYLDSEHISHSAHEVSFSSSNFVDLDWLSSSGNSCEEEPFERFSIANSSIAGNSSENVINGVIIGGDAPSSSVLDSNTKGRERTGSELSYRDAQSKVLEEYPDTFVQWVNNGQTLCN
ncbi:phosphoinositide phosphatase SAC3 isoform X2 [Vigna radiata var. radiata]|uniref:Phosphoinositide phosphatase SAC3 isoform X2 n=1 Tax=Vigna radiata var. radiata TaxID=3916 RepID=A0A1S3U4T8_VIGRR|nr:phosphoinositide phosphatase SAC3 isoform X2 [Vigna radiata var. radiata]